MNLTRLLLPLAAILLIALAACGGNDDGGPASPTSSGEASPSSTDTGDDAAYFDALSQTLSDLATDSTALDDFRAGAFDTSLTEDQRVANAEDFAERYEEFARDAHDRILEITPGPSLSGEHGALVDALADLITLGQDIAASLDETPVSTEQQFGDLFFELEGQSLELRVRDACFRIQQVASDAGIQAALICPR